MEPFPEEAVRACKLEIGRYINPSRNLVPSLLLDQTVIAFHPCVVWLEAVRSGIASTALSPLNCPLSANSHSPYERE